MKRTIVWIALSTLLQWTPAIASGLALERGFVDQTTYLLGQDDHWTRQRQKEDKTQTPLLGNTTANSGAIFS